MTDLILQFCTEPKIGSAIIRWGTHCPYSHVDGLLPDGSLLGARTGWLTTYGEGVRVRPPNYTTFSAIAHRSYPVDAEKAIAVAMTYVGDPYSWQEDAGYVIPWFWKHVVPKSYNCSAFWAHVIRKCGVDPFLAPLPSISPRDLFYSPLGKAA